MYWAANHDVGHVSNRHPNPLASFVKHNQCELSKVTQQVSGNLASPYWSQTWEIPPSNTMHWFHITLDIDTTARLLQRTFSLTRKVYTHVQVFSAHNNTVALYRALCTQSAIPTTTNYRRVHSASTKPEELSLAWTTSCEVRLRITEMIHNILICQKNER